MFKRVEVASTDSRQFIKDIIELAKLGATLPDDAGVFKGIMLRTQVELPEDVLVKASPTIRVLPVSKAEREKYAKEKAKEFVIPAKGEEGVETEVSPSPRRGRKKVEDVEE